MCNSPVGFLEEEMPEGIPIPEDRQPLPQVETPSIEILRNVFGHEQFLPFQEDIIEHIRKGEDTLVVLPNRGWKVTVFTNCLRVFLMT